MRLGQWVVASLSMELGGRALRYAFVIVRIDRRTLVWTNVT
jgi:hypothetical protein